MKNQLTKKGLTGTSGFNVEGLNPASHINAPYAAAKDGVFVETGDMGWQRMERATAEKRSLRIIRCSYCRRPATTVDHSWPYLTEATHCAWHSDWRKHADQVQPI